MSVLQQLIAGLPAVATSWQATIGYVAVVIAFITVSLKVTRNKNILNKLKSLPEKDRARVIQMDIGAAYLETGLSPEQWLQQQRQRYYFIAFLAVCILGVALGMAAVLRGSGGEHPPDPHAAERVALDFVSKLHETPLVPAYELFPADIKKNISFAAFKDETARLLYQWPGDSLKNSVEQSVGAGTVLSVFIISEFSVASRIRNVIGFIGDANGWKLWNYNWQPTEWPLVWPSSTLTRVTAAEAIAAYGALSDAERTAPLPDSFRGNVTGSTPGWKLFVQSVIPEHDPFQCTVVAGEQGASVTVELKHVIGGCKLQAGHRIVVNALISAIDSSRIELQGVRFYPGT